MKRSKRQQLLQGVVITLLAFLASWGSGHSALGHYAGRLVLDPLIRSDSEVDEDRIVLVDITEDDYEKIFQRTRPLNPAILVELIRAAHTGGAKLIAVDISTADWPRDWQKDKRVGSLPDTRIVWARGFYQESGRHSSHYVFESLLGGAASASGECYGAPALASETGVVRGFYSGMVIGQRIEPSFVHQIVHRAEHGSCLPEVDEEEELIINFSAKIRSESASTLLAQARQRDWGRRPEYDGKIIILSGTFHSGADIFETPVGTRAGFHIIGQAVSSVMRGTAHQELGEGTALLIDLGIGVLLLLCGLLIRGWPLRVLSVVLAIVVIGISLYAFRQYYLFVSFLPFLVGIVAHYVLESHYHPDE